jgi:hypothetical protein
MARLPRFRFVDASGGEVGGPVVTPVPDRAPELHLWLTPPTRDASAGAPGEHKAGSSYEIGDPEPEERRARHDQRLRPGEFPGPSTSEEMPLAEYNQGAQPHPLYDQTGPSPASVPSPASAGATPLDEGGPAPRGTKLDQFGNASGSTMIDARSIRVSGKDATGRMWNAAVWGGSNPQQGEGSNIHPLDPEMRRTGDKMLRNLEVNSGDMIAGLGAFQRMLNNFYRR